nr:DUF268 domain-containing protein [uncultured Rhodoferax sp.]
MRYKKLLIRLHSFLSEQLGLDPLKTFAGVRGFPEYVRDLAKFRRGYRGRLILNPYLGDRYKEGGSTKNEYFWQDLLVAQRIFREQPLRHVDVGSRVDGFVAHVASFRHIEVFDIRPLASDIPGVVFRQADLMSVDSVDALCGASGGYCDSLSCLHAIEHFGLGRYGDPVDPIGYRRGIENLSKLLLPGGRLYLSTPVGSERVEFNANWVFDPNTIVTTANAVGLRLDELTVLDQQGGHETVVRPTAEKLDLLAKEHYRLGIFHFLKEGGH